MSVLHFGRWHTQAALRGVTPWSFVSLGWERGALQTLMQFKSELSVFCGSAISQLLFGRDRVVQPWLFTAVGSVWAEAGLTCAAKWRQCFAHKSQVWWTTQRKKASQCRHHYWDTLEKGAFWKSLDPRLAACQHHWLTQCISELRHLWAGRSRGWAGWGGASESGLYFCMLRERVERSQQ